MQILLVGFKLHNPQYCSNNVLEICVEITKNNRVNIFEE